MFEAEISRSNSTNSLQQQHPQLWQKLVFPRKLAKSFLLKFFNTNFQGARPFKFWSVNNSKSANDQFYLFLSVYCHSVFMISIDIHHSLMRNLGQSRRALQNYWLFLMFFNVQFVKCMPNRAKFCSMKSYASKSIERSSVSKPHTLSWSPLRTLSEDRNSQISY